MAYESTLLFKLSVRPFVGYKAFRFNLKVEQQPVSSTSVLRTPPRVKADLVGHDGAFTWIGGVVIDQ